MVEKEIWKKYPDYSFIEVSNLGNVRTKNRYATDKNGVKRFIKGRVLKQSPSHNGYMSVSFHTNGKRVCLRVNRMVAITFIPNPHNYPEVNHKDCNRLNNRLDNLEWCSRKYNRQYREKYGNAAGRSVTAVNLKTGKVYHFKSRHEAARKLGFYVESVSAVVNGRQNTTGDYWFTEDDSEITEEKIREIKAKAHSFGGVMAINPETSEVSWFESQSEAGRQLGINVRRVNKVIKGKQQQTGNRWFCNADSTAVEKTRAKFGDKIAEKVEQLLREHQ